MNKNKVCLLSTILLDRSLVDKAAANGMDMDMVPFIDVTLLNTGAVEREVKKLYTQPATVVFTSVNAVNAVANYNGSMAQWLNGSMVKAANAVVHNKAAQPGWKIYCIGNATKANISELFGSLAIAGTAPDAAKLADVIIKDGNNTEVIFFCSDKRRDELPDKLRAAGIGIKEIVVYRTMETPVKVDKQYDGILFFSPSAVNSFFTKNEAQTGTTFFAIGNTTATALKKVTNNTIIVSEKQSKEALIELAITHYLKEQKLPSCF